MTARGRKAEAAASAELYLAEPPASYRILAPLVVDCSLLSAVLFDEQQSARPSGRSPIATCTRPPFSITKSSTSR